MLTAPTSLEEVGRNAEAALYPIRVLTGCETALILFGAGFHGRQDGYWIAKAGLRATCIDHDAKLLDEMAAVYPTDWDFIEADAYEWAGSTTGHWDIVSIDCPTGQFERCAGLLPLFCGLARRKVVLGAGPKHKQEVAAPDGWKLTEVRYRSSYEGGVYWAVVEAT